MYDSTWRDSGVYCSWSAAFIDLNARYKLALGFPLVTNLGHSLLGGLINHLLPLLCCILTSVVRYKLFYKIRVDNFNFSSENSYPILNRFCTDVSSAVLERGRVVIGRLEIYQTHIVKLPNNRTHMHAPTSSLPVEWTITGYRRMYMLHTYGRKTLTVLQICLQVHK